MANSLCCPTNRPAQKDFQLSNPHIRESETIEYLIFVCLKLTQTFRLIYHLISSDLCVMKMNEKVNKVNKDLSKVSMQIKPQNLYLCVLLLATY